MALRTMPLYAKNIKEYETTTRIDNHYRKIGSQILKDRWTNEYTPDQKKRFYTHMKDRFGNKVWEEILIETGKRGEHNPIDGLMYIMSVVDYGKIRLDPMKRKAIGFIYDTPETDNEPSLTDEEISALIREMDA